MRLAANVGASLSLVEPLGFQLSDRKLKRAGLDYAHWRDVKVYPDLPSALASFKHDRIFPCSTKGTTTHTTLEYQNGDTFVFGPETRGLPSEMLARYADRVLRIPMRPDSRSLNLSNAVAVVIYEAWRQLGYAGAIND